MIAENSQSRCREQAIPFYRFSPTLHEIIAYGETDNEKLFNMVIDTKGYLKTQEKELGELINIFKAVASSSQDLTESESEESESEKSESKEHMVSESMLNQLDLRL